MERVIKNDNLLEEILLRLPAEKVHGFNQVSKRWYKLISSPSFRRRHHNSSSSSNIILMIDRYIELATSLLAVCNGVTVFKTSLIHPDKLLSSIQPLSQKIDESEEIEFGICDVHNGLFLFSLARKQNHGEVYYVVCNPLTKEYHELPRTTKHKSPLITYWQPQVAFAPLSKPCNYYKVIHISYDYASHRVEVYSSETGIWKDLGHIKKDIVYESRYVVWDNCLVLVPECNRWSGEAHIVDSERLCVSHSSLLVSSLIEKKSSCYISYLGESGGVLYAIVIDTCNADGENNHYKLWEMKEVDGSWKEKFQFNTDMRPLYIHRDGEHVWLSLINSNTVYYCLDGNTKVLKRAGWVRYSLQGWNIRSYTPTLFPLRQ